MKTKTGRNTNSGYGHSVVQRMSIKWPDDSPTWRLLLQTRIDELDTMKSTITCILILLAVACTRARNVNYSASLPDISSPSLPSRQWNTKDEIGQANFGYSYPGQAASNVLDSAGNMAGSWAYVNPEGKVVNVSYTADERGFRVSTNVLPSAASVADLAVEPVKTAAAKAASAPIDSIVNDDDCIGNRPARSKRQTGDEMNIGNRNPIVSKLEDFNYSNNKYTEETGWNQYPFMAAILRFDETSKRYKLACGGSLISATKILAAAHCVIQNNTIPALDKLVVKLGMHFLNETADDAEVTMRIQQVEIHENYDQLTKFNDIAIVTLESRVEFTDRISTVCLPKECHQGAFSGYARALGWGNTKEGERNSDVLRHTTTEFLSTESCIKRISGGRQIELADHMICALHSDNLCQNYDGGPMILERPISTNEECPWLQFGIISSTSGCYGKGEPDVYTRLTSFWNWIDDKGSPW